MAWQQCHYCFLQLSAALHVVSAGLVVEPFVSISVGDSLQKSNLIQCLLHSLWGSHYFIVGRSLWETHYLPSFFVGLKSLSLFWVILNLRREREEEEAICSEK